MLATSSTISTRQDLERLVFEATPEDSELEFKEKLPIKDGRQEPWSEGKNEIGERAKHEILAEVIAFANAFGGTLIVGVQESDDKPARAVAISPLRKCQDLADRFRLICRDLIEPRIPTIEVDGISTSDDGSGVVVFRIPASRAAPHRHLQTRECYFRHADRSEKMTMREIQDLTLRTERGLAASENTFQRSEAEFDSALSRMSEYGITVGHGINVTAVPLSLLSLGRVFDDDRLRPATRQLSGRFDKSDARVDIHLPFELSTWKPMIGGTWMESGSGASQARTELHQDGTINYRLLERGSLTREHRLPPTYLLAMVANAMLTIERIRRSTHGNATEFGISVVLSNPTYPLGLLLYDGKVGEPSGTIPNGRHSFPRYAVSTVSDYALVISELNRDLWAAAHKSWDIPINLNFTEVIEDERNGR